MVKELSQTFVQGKFMDNYLNFSTQSKKINNQYGLTRHEIELLDLVARHCFLKIPITVGDLVHQRDIGSTLTLQGALKRLISKKLLATRHRKEDARVKDVVLTKPALLRYKKLYRELRKAASKI